ncbi:hypothetical protein SUGI_0127870 [Cryptomeria japonica]|uniref:F-box/FBD/LRR-repeat protein At2g26030-like n=1 Tax=Cryptomeria japonica TaxID=3369 RepID=UPI002408C1FB|nr:F-box/FBD/LRR-repeat protein At2g26030-like [Cryptomeria japonica]GLJ10417.1 hypothetical protein SUGI_0127870 [Cryptomeria japonica]
MPAHDAFYTLPDSLISFILSKMPIRDAVKSSILSKRWRFLYTQMPELTLAPHLILGSASTSLNPLFMSRVETIVSNILLLHTRNLKGFHLHSTWLDSNEWLHFSRENVCRWVRYVSTSNLQHLTLYDRTTFPECLHVIPPPALFSCSDLVTLKLHDYVLTSFPINFNGFPHLVTCHLRYVQMTDESLVSLISLCPCLQNLQIVGYVRLRNAVIFSPTIEHLSMGWVKSLSVNCPKLRTLSGEWIEDLSVNGVRFYELCYDAFHLQMDCGGTPSELKISCSPGLKGNFGHILGVVSASRFLHIVGNFQSLKKLVIYLGNPFKREADMGAPLLDLFRRLPNLQTLFMLGFFVQELARDHIPVCLTSPHVNLKKIRVQIREFDYKEVAVISCLLQSVPSLEALEIKLPHEYDESQCSKFFKDIAYLRRASLLARIIVLDKCPK